jgi:hydroxyethylthiazole kinase-like uncharacterized protein yjeF
MILGTGTDIIEIFRIEKVVQKTNFLERFFTEQERSYLQNKRVESIAGYFAAKEAIVKALGTGFSGFKFTDIEIIKENSAPKVRLHGAAQAIADSKGIKEIKVSISHCKEYATAVAVAEGEEYSVKDIETGLIKKSFYPLSLLKKRNKNSHKGDFGRVYIIGGSYTMSGAVILAARAALRSGAGLVTCVIPDRILNRVGTCVIEATYMPLREKNGCINLSEEEINQIIRMADAISIGVGLGREEHLKQDIAFLIRNSTKPVVIDADGIYVLSSQKEVLKSSKSKIVLTPHPGEMSYLTGLTIDYINQNREKVVVEFAREYGCIVLLKGANTVVTDGERLYINETGNPGMATGGSGDVLTGIITSLIGQGYDPYDAAVLGSFIHGAAGDEAYKYFGYGLTAGDIINYLGKYLR